MTREPFIYRDDGERERFTPARARQRLAGCLLCGGGPIVSIAVFEPYDERTRDAVLRLRQQPLRPLSSPGLFYGLCVEHTDDAICGDRQRTQRLIARVEEIVIAFAARVKLH